MTTSEVIYGHAIILDNARRDIHLKLLHDRDDLFRWYTEDGVGMQEDGRTVGEAWNMLVHSSYNTQWRLRFLDDWE
ncbi:MAG: hypothetical protein IT169_09260 [Bryobacterales bacterium]|nr:hypothetical protein [Bryobacterales bacterium]MCZ2152427.1 hypothetical protein [Bryobacterales bacterium]